MTGSVHVSVFAKQRCPKGSTRRRQADGVPEKLLSYARDCGPKPSGTGATGDLGLSTPVSIPSCDGSGVVVLGSATRPSWYRADIAALLKAHSGTSYLRTDRACSWLRKATAAAVPIYAVYRPAGNSEKSICAAVEKAGGEASANASTLRRLRIRLRPRAQRPATGRRQSLA